MLWEDGDNGLMVYVLTPNVFLSGSLLQLLPIFGPFICIKLIII